MLHKPYSVRGDARIGEHPVNPDTGQRYNPGDVTDPNHPNHHSNWRRRSVVIDDIAEHISRVHDRNRRIGEHPINPVTGQRYNPGNVDDPNHPNNTRGIRY